MMWLYWLLSIARLLFIHSTLERNLSFIWYIEGVYVIFLKVAAGCQRLSWFNKALLGKMALEICLRVRHYGGEWCVLNLAVCWGIGVQMGVTGMYGVSIWKYIRAGWDKFVGFISFKVGGWNLNKALAWFLVWGAAVEGKVSCIISDSTWQLFRIAHDIEASVADHLVLAREMHCLDSSFIWRV